MEKAKLTLFAVLILCVLSISAWAEQATFPNEGALESNGLNEYIYFGGEAQSSDSSVVEEVPAAQLALVKLDIVGPGQAVEDSTFQYKAVAYYDNGGSKDVTNSAEWAVEPDKYALIDVNGLLYTDILKKPAENVTVYAQYSEYDSTVEAEKLVTIRPICPIGSALDFDGVDDYVNLGDVDEFEFGGKDFTVSAWFYTKGPHGAPDKNGVIISKYNWDIPGYSGRQWALYQWSNGKIVFYTNPTGTTNTHEVLASSTGEYTGQWVHVAAVRSGPTKLLYINGQLNVTGSTNGVVTGKSVNVYLGTWYDSNYGMCNDFNGKIDELQIWSKALSKEEIEEKMYSKLTGNEPDLAGCWDFDEGQGQVAHDLSVSGNDGFLGGSDATQGSDPSWVEPGAPIDFCTVPQMIDRNLTEALDLKKEVLEIVQQALESEKASMEMLEELFRAGDYSNFGKNDIVKARQGIFSAMQHEVQGAGAVNKSIDKLEESADILGLDLDEE